MKNIFFASCVVGTMASQVPAWGQCGGSGYSGSALCSDGYACVYINQWYYQCQETTMSSASTTSSVAAPSQTNSAGAVQYLGRVNPATKELSWPGTGVSFVFTGTSATIGITSISGTNSADLIVDGGAPTVISNVIGTSITTPAGLSYGTHTVILRKRSEAVYGSVFLGSISADGPITAPALSKRQIEIIGDSITVGYGLDGTAPCTNTAALEDNPKT